MKIYRLLGKFFRYVRIGFSWRLSRSVILRYPPEEISIELTNVCSFKCSFCPQSDANHFKVVSKSTLNITAAEILFRKLRDGGVKADVMHWTLDGEPFLNKDIGPICASASAYGWRTYIFPTNGFYCTEAVLGKLPNSAGLSYVLCIDFCADQKLFETHRGTPGSWERVRQNILNILQEPKFGHISVLVGDMSSYTIFDAEELDLQFLKLKQIFGNSPRITFKPLIYHNAGGHISGMLERKKMESTSYNLCPYPWTSMFIASNGDVVACCRDLEHKTVLGNLFFQDLVEIWNGAAYQRLRRNLLEERPECNMACERCDLPFDRKKFTARHLLRTSINRLGMFK